MIKETWWSIFTDPHHIIAELAWTLIQDIVFGFLIYKLAWKKHIYPHLQNKFDKAHDDKHENENDNYSQLLFEEFGTDWGYAEVDYDGGWGTRKEWK